MLILAIEVGPGNKDIEKKIDSIEDDMVSIEENIGIIISKLDKIINGEQKGLLITKNYSLLI